VQGPCDKHETPHAPLPPPASSTTKTGRHDIAEILLKVALSTTNQSKSLSLICSGSHLICLSVILTGFFNGELQSTSRNLLYLLHEQAFLPFQQR
jgi:hypothetical protein